MTGEQAHKPPSKGSARKARKIARQKATQWSELRTATGGAPSGPSSHARPSLLEAGRTPWQHTAAAQVALPISAALLFIASAIFSLPILGQTWRPWGVVPLLASLWLLNETVKTWKDRSPSRVQLAGAGAATLLLVFFTLGAVTQSAPNGQPLLPGTTSEKTYSEGQEALVALEVLSSNMKFLDLTAEQVATLAPLLEEARGQALAIAQRWNPVNGAEGPVPAMLQVHLRINEAAVKEARALELAQSLASTPEPALEAQLEALISDLQVLLGEGAGSAVEVLNLASSEAGLGKEFPRGAA